MATAVDICNLALAHLGDKANVSSIDPPEGSQQAAHCARYYPIARDSILEEHVWTFATRREALALLGDGPTGWTYRYTCPNAALRLIDVRTPAAQGPQDFVVEGDNKGRRTVLTNAEDAEVRYIQRVTDTTKYSQQFVEALSWLLASYLALPVTGDPNIKQSASQSYALRLMQAKNLDAGQERLKDARDEYRPPHLAARTS
jgi:hypothetical protein